MDRDGTEATLHRRVLGAIARGAEAQEQSRVVHEQHRAVHEALHDTMAAIRRRRLRAAKSVAQPKGS
jgi:hypothetical protein